jgi:phage pi2 protein 07
MPVTEFKTLSSTPNFPFSTALEDFFDSYEVFDDVECYQMFFCPHGEGTSFDDLYKIKFKSQIVILNIIDSIIDKQNNIAIEELKEFCNKNLDKKFILFNGQFQLKNLLNLTNLYCSTIMPVIFKKRYQDCKKEKITNKWIFLNAYPRTHRMASISYLLSKKYFKNGYISYDDDYFVRYSDRNTDYYSFNINSVPEFIKEDIQKGYQRFKSKKFNRLNILPYKDKNIENYNLNLLPIYEKTAVEIVAGTMFFQPSSILGEKEIQSVYGKNFPIYINSVGAVNEMKRFFNVDMFDDIINHSYDTVKDPFKRIKLAIDKNKKLLNGSINIRELWFDNQKRFDENCKKLDSLIYDQICQKKFNEKIITAALDHFNILYKGKHNDSSK